MHFKAEKISLQINKIKKNNYVNKSAALEEHFFVLKNWHEKKLTQSSVDFVAL